VSRPSSVSTLGDLAREGAACLEERGVPSARFDAEVLLALSLGVDRSALLARTREAAPPGAESTFRNLLERRGRRIPLQHLTGTQEFWSLEFAVDRRVLIPRPETELVVETVLALAASPAPRIADIGTGSGNIAVSLARELPGARVVATDISEEALEVARSNAVRHGVETRIRFLQGDLAAPLKGEVPPGGLDFLVSNPPYVAESEMAALEPEVRDHEPRLALVPPGGDPLAFYPGLLAAGALFLQSGGRLVLELPAGGAEQIPPLIRRTADLELIEVRSDYTGIPRVLVVGRR
jgi:release factor glutamine methyltransferase